MKGIVRPAFGAPTFNTQRAVGPKGAFDDRLDAQMAMVRLSESDESLAKESSMLVLSRKKNESIIINDDITIVVVEIRGDKVRLGVEAPKEVPVHRNEVYEAIRRNQQKPDVGEQPVTQHDSSPSAE